MQLARSRAGRAQRRGCRPSRQFVRRSCVREWQTVTVACRCSRSIDTGFPTISLRPMTTACLPAISMLLRRSSSMMPAGVHAIRSARFCTSRPTFTGVTPSTSFDGSIASNTFCMADGPSESGNGACTRIPSVAGSALSVSISDRISSSDVDAGRCDSVAFIPSSPADFSLLFT